MQRQRAVDHLEELPEVIEDHLVDAHAVSGRGNWIVHGEVVGDSEVQGAVFLGQASRWTGDLTADLIVIKGRFDGNLTAHQKVEVRSTADIHGNVAGALVAIAKGARIAGHVAPSSCVVYFEERRA